MADLWKFLLGGGALAFILAIGQAIRWLTDRVSAREDKLQTQVKDWQRATVRRATFEAKQHDWWRYYAGQLEYIVTTRLGEDALPKKRPYPKEPLDDEEADHARAVES